MRRHAGTAVRSLLLATVALAGVLVPGTAHAASCFGSGVPVTTDVTLTTDIIDCADHGIEVGKGGITIDLNGHLVDGDDDGDDFGIYNPGFNKVTIVGPGTIQQFGSGILLEDTDGNSISDVEVTANNGEGILAYQTKTKKDAITENTTMIDNEVTLNDGSGIVVYRNSTATTITDNNVTSNDEDGIFFGGSGEDPDIFGVGVPDTNVLSIKVNKAVIDHNVVDANAGTGIAFDATGREIDEEREIDGPGGKGNVISNNDVINNGFAPTSVGHDLRNDGAAGGHGIKVAGRLSSTTIDDNLVTTNGNPGAGVCFQRTGAGIFVVGQGKGLRVTGNTADGNAMSGIFVAGDHKNVVIDDNASVRDNVNNCGTEEAGIMLAGVFDGASVSGNQSVILNGGSGIKAAGHTRSLAVNFNVASSNVAASFEDSGGIVVHGRSLNLEIIGNETHSNSNSTATGHGIDIRGSVRRVGDGSHAVLIEGNEANSNEGHGIGVLVQASKPCPGKADGPDLDSDLDCSKKGKIGDPGPESADDDCNNDANENPNLSGGCPDVNQNDVGNVLVNSNQTHSNGTDGIFAVTDLILSNNQASSNVDHGIEHEDDPTVRGGDPEDGPHQLEDGGGNNAGGNGTDCSPGLAC